MGPWTRSGEVRLEFNPQELAYSARACAEAEAMPDPQRYHLQRPDQRLRKEQEAIAGPGSLRGNAAARPGAHQYHLQRLNQYLREGQEVIAGPSGLRGNASARPKIVGMG